MSLVLFPEPEPDDCDRCLGRRMVPAPCPDNARYAKQGASCTVSHQRTCPKCFGTGKRRSDV
jgi:DnaJ-class molecular chaperone